MSAPFLRVMPRGKHRLNADPAAGKQQHSLRAMGSAGMRRIHEPGGKAVTQFAGKPKNSCAASLLISGSEAQHRSHSVRFMICSGQAGYARLTSFCR